MKDWEISSFMPAVLDSIIYLFIIYFLFQTVQLKFQFGNSFQHERVAMHLRKRLSCTTFFFFFLKKRRNDLLREHHGCSNPVIPLNSNTDIYKDWSLEFSLSRFPEPLGAELSGWAHSQLHTAGVLECDLQTYPREAVVWTEVSG